MGVVHKTRVSALTRGYASDWNDSHEFDPTNEFTFYDCLIFNAFSTYWDDTQKSGGGAVTVSCEGSAGAGHLFASLASGSGAGDYISIRPLITGAAENLTSPLDLPVFTTSVHLATIDTADTPAEIGLFECNVTPFTANQAGAYFRVKDNHLYAVVGDGTAETEEDLGLLTSFENLYFVLRVAIESTTIRFYVNNLVAAAVGINTHRPVKNLTIKFSCQKTTAGENILKWDSCALQRLRKTS